MGTVRRFLMTILGARGAAAITVGSQITASGEQTVAIVLADGWKHSKAALSPEGARRIARQMTEWADAADKHNTEWAHGKTIMQWRYVTEAAIDAAKGEVKDSAPVAAAT